MNEFQLENQTLLADALGDMKYQMVFLDEVLLRKSPPHVHSYYELFYVKEGTAFLNDNTALYCLKKGDLLIVPPNVYHNLDVSKTVSCYNLLFSFTKKASASGEKLFDEFSAAFAIQSVFFFQHCHHIKALLELLSDAYSSNCCGKEMRRKALSASLLFSLFDTIRAENPLRAEVIPQKDSHYKYQIDTYFGKYYAQPITVNDLAEKLFLSPKTVGRIIKKTYGKTFNEIKNSFRIETAKKLLLTTDDTVESISAQVGYASARSFYTCFFDYVGCTPGDYRHNHSL